MRKVVITKMAPAFSDKRGDIIDILKENIHHVGLITFEKKDIVRANHYHKQQTQWSYTMSGKIEFFWKDSQTPEAPVQSAITEPGDLITIPPMVIHAYRAVEPCSMITMTSESREGSGYEDDTIRVDSIIE